MIATILKSSPTFNAVFYNEHKVSQGVATLLEIKNFGEINTNGYSKPQELQQFLLDYSSMNGRIKNPQFHLALSCKGHEWTHEQLLKFAHDYLNEMGYGSPEQPLLVYAHHDTDNSHIHIITSRVAPDGKKINDSNERKRSQRVLDKLLGNNITEKTKADVAEAFSYDFTDIRQFKSVLASMGYESFETDTLRDGFLCVKKGGNVQMKIPKDRIWTAIDHNRLCRASDARERVKWKQILKKYRDQNTTRQGLEKDIHTLFGVSLVWLGKKDDPFGYDLVDHKKKRVYDGYKIIDIKHLTDFMLREEHINQIQVYIDECLVANPYMTTKELNSNLKKFGGYVKNNRFRHGRRTVILDDTIATILKRNNKLAWWQSFNPSSVAERDFLCRLCKLSPDLINVKPQPKGKYKDKEVAGLFDILSKKDMDQKISSFKDAGYRMMKTEEGIFAVNFNSNVLIDMSMTGFPKSLYADMLINQDGSINRGRSINEDNTVSRPTPRNLSYANKTGRRRSYVAGSSSQNREWEVGKRGYDRDDPDRNQSMGY